MNLYRLSLRLEDKAEAYLRNRRTSEVPVVFPLSGSQICIPRNVNKKLYYKLVEP